MVDEKKSLETTAIDTEEENFQSDSLDIRLDLLVQRMIGPIGARFQVCMEEGITPLLKDPRYNHHNVGPNRKALNKDFVNLEHARQHDHHELKGEIAHGRFMNGDRTQGQDDKIDHVQGRLEELENRVPDPPIEAALVKSQDQTAALTHEVLIMATRFEDTPGQTPRLPILLRSKRSQ